MPNQDNRAKRDKRDCVVVFLDITKAFDSIGHQHIIRTLQSLPLPTSLREAIVNLQTGNSTRIHTNGNQSKPIEIKCGVFQGAPLSPSLFNLSIDYVLSELSEPEIAEEYGYEINKDLENITTVLKIGMCFAPDCNHYSKRRMCRFLSFPKKPELLRKWISLVWRGVGEVGAHSMLCSCHFLNGNKDNILT
ncbi:hypothetical protein JTB14_008462 [Gonioctena quinquepunctata]|nr:hypothetical protein JTB14_008462 [Gonioctena quinquepunctata]